MHNLTTSIILICFFCYIQLNMSSSQALSQNQKKYYNRLMLINIQEQQKKVSRTKRQLFKLIQHKSMYIFASIFIDKIITQYLIVQQSQNHYRSSKISGFSMLKQNTPQEKVMCQSDESNLFIFKKLATNKQKNLIPKCTIVNFSSSLANPHQLNPLKKKYIKTVPHFNKDGLYYTSSFVVPFYDNFTTTKKRKANQKQKYANFQAHIKRVLKLADPEISRKESKKPKKEMLTIKDKLGGKDQNNNFQRMCIQFDPGNENYCAVCSLSFADYWFHINSSPHYRAVCKNETNSYINDLCLKYRLTNKKTQGKIQINSPKISLPSPKASSVTQQIENVSVQAGNNLIEFPKMGLKNLRPKTITSQKPMESMQFKSQNQNPGEDKCVSLDNFLFEQSSFDMLFKFSGDLLGDDYEMRAQRNEKWGGLSGSEGLNFEESNDFLNFAAFEVL